MIEEVNGASATLSKTSKADEPVCFFFPPLPILGDDWLTQRKISQIVRILNSHLSQLQVIDQGTTELQGKVNSAQKAGQMLSSRFGHGFSSSGIGGGGAGAGVGAGGFGGGGNGASAAEDFYRSYMGRR